MHRPLAAIAVLGLLLVAGSADAASLYVRASGTVLKEKPGPGGPTLTKLAIGQKCKVVEKTGSWVKVTLETPDQKEWTGYVFGPKLGEDKPDKERFGGSVALSASEGDTAMALRGLSATSEKYAERTRIEPEDVAAVKAMEKRTVTPAEVERFLKEGKLGEYSE